MAANFSEPTVSTTYTNFPTQVIDNVNAALQQLSVGSPSNVPTGAIKFDLDMSGGNRWKKFDGTNYVDLTDHFNLNAKVTCTGLRLGDGASGGVNAIFLGDDNDLRIYHDNSAGHSFIRDFNGTGNLKICGSQVDIMNNGAGESMAQFVQNGAVTLYNNNTARIATSSSGATITGTLTTTGAAAIGTNITLDGSGGVGNRSVKIGHGRTGDGQSFLDLITDTTYSFGARFIRGASADATSNIQHHGTGSLNLTTIEAGRINLNTNSSLALTVTSAGNVGIGLTDPTFKFQVYSGNSDACRIESNASGANLELKDNDTITQLRTVDGRLHIQADTGNSVDNSQIRFQIDGSNKALIDTNGGLGIGTGTTAPNRKLEISSNDLSSIIRLSNTDTTITNTQRIGMLEFHGSDSGNSGVASFVEAVANGAQGAADLRFGVGTAGSAFEVARFGAGGQLLIGLSSSVNSRAGTDNFQPTLQIHSESNASMSITRYGNLTTPARLHLNKARGTTSTPLSVNNGDILHEMTFSGYDGSNFSNGARIESSVSAAPSANTIPSNLSFFTANTSGTLNANLIITDERHVGIIETSPAVPLHVKQLTDSAGVLRLEDSGSNTRYLTVDVTNSLTTFEVRHGGSYGIMRFSRFNGTTAVESARFSNSSNFLIGTTSAQAIGGSNARVTVDGGGICTSGSVVSGFAGSGQAALSVNDGGGNCNLCFNHLANSADNDGVSGRITVNTDASSGANNVAGMDFQLNNNVTGGSSATTTSVFSIHRGRGDEIGGSGTVSTVYGQVRVPTGTTDGNIVGLCLGTDHDTGLCRTGSNSLGISCNNNLSFVATDGSVRVAGELNLMGNTTESAKYIDIGFRGHAFQMRRTTFNDQDHDYFLRVLADGTFSTRSIGTTSDVKLKKNITTISDGAIENIKKLRPVKFDWIKEDLTNNNNGFIAQELKEVFPNLVYGTEYDPTLNDPEKGTKSGIKSDGYVIGLVGIVAHITKALQEAIAKIETLETEVAALKSA